jgi:hypothetical protein
LPQETLGVRNAPSADFPAAATFASSPNSDSAVHPRDAALDYLKLTIVLLMVAHHSCLAYVTFAHSSLARQLAPIPVVDAVSWRFFDYAQNFNDVFFMSLMFFISGLFVWPSIRRWNSSFHKRSVAPARWTVRGRRSSAHATCLLRFLANCRF